MKCNSNDNSNANIESSSDPLPSMKFTHTSQSNESGHAIGITRDGAAYSWSIRKQGPVNEFGQLGRGPTPKSSKSKLSNPGKVTVYDGDDGSQGDKSTSPSLPVTFLRGYTGGTDESGHSALLDITRRHLYLCGCDRWQQLGLGSHHAGALGYTWKGGKIWQTEFYRNEFLDYFLEKNNESIRDVALGGDHTVVLTESNRDVITFGRGGEGQLGGVGKPFVSAPTKSKILSSDKVSAVCAVKDCTLTINDSGDILKMVGKCRGRGFQEYINACRERAKNEGLVRNTQ